MREPGGFRRVFRLRGRRGVAADVDEELDFHLRRLQDDLVAEGWSEDEARAEAGRRFGNLTVVRDECRRIGKRREGEMKMSDMLDVFRQDLAFAVRQAARQPLVSALTFLTLVLGVAATAVVFSVVNAVVLRPLPFPDPDRLVEVRPTSTAVSMGSRPTSRLST